MKARGKKVNYSDEGYTLIELILVVGITGVLTSIGVPTVGRYVKSVKERVCEMNILELQKGYEIYLELEGVEHSRVTLQDYLSQYEVEVCPAGGEVRYVEDEIKCSQHSEEEAEEDEDVPYL